MMMSRSPSSSLSPSYMDIISMSHSPIYRLSTRDYITQVHILMMHTRCNYHADHADHADRAVCDPQKACFRWVWGTICAHSNLHSIVMFTTHPRSPSSFPLNITSYLTSITDTASVRTGALLSPILSVIGPRIWFR